VVETQRGTPSGDWVWTAALVSIAFLFDGFLLVLLIGGAYSNFVDGHPLWGVGCLLLAAIPFVVAAQIYRRGSSRHVSASQHIRAISAALILVGLVLGVVAVFSSPI
jgi:hypothetical protein